MNSKFLCFAASSFIFFGCGTDRSSPDSTSKAVVDVTTQTQLRIGSGVNVDTEDVFEECIDVTNAVFEPEDGQPAVLGPGSASANLKVDVRSLTTYQDIDTFTDVNVSANIKSATYGGGFNYSNTEKYALTSDVATVGIHAAADYGRWYIESPRLKPEYQELYKKSPEDFFRRCGTEYVSGYRMGQGIMVLLSTSKKSVETYEKISASVNASVQSGLTAGSASASFLSIASDLLKMGSLNIQVQAYGAGGISSLQKLITAEAEVDSLAQEISRMVGDMKQEQSTRYKLLTSPYPGIDYKGSKTSPIMREYRRMILTELFSDYRRLSQDLRRVTEIVRNSSSFKSKLGKLCEFATPETQTCDDYIGRLDHLKKEIEAAIAIIDGLSRQCAAATEITQCETASAKNVRVSDLTIKTWEQQYKRLLEIEYIKYLATL